MFIEFSKKRDELTSVESKKCGDAGLDFKDFAFKMGFNATAETWLAMYDAINLGYLLMMKECPEKEGLYKRSEAFKALEKANNFLGTRVSNPNSEVSK